MSCSKFEIAMERAPIKKWIMIGQSGGGKTSLGNHLLGGRGFENKPTKEVTSSVGNIENNPIGVTDTPGMGQAGTDDEKTLNDIMKAFADFPYIVMFLFVLSSRPLTNGCKKAISQYKEMLGREFEKRIVFVFTGFDTGMSTCSFEAFLDSACPYLKGIIHLCSKRCIPWFSRNDNTNGIRKLFDYSNTIYREHGYLTMESINIMTNNRLFTHLAYLQQQQEQTQLQLQQLQQQLQQQRQQQLLHPQHDVSVIQDRIEGMEMTIAQIGTIFNGQTHDVLTAQEAFIEFKRDLEKLRKDVDKIRIQSPTSSSE